MIILLGLYGSSVLLLNEDRLKSLIALHVERDSGRRIDIQGDLKVRLFPGLRLEAEQVTISGPSTQAESSRLEAAFLEMNLRLLPMIRGELKASQVTLRGASLDLASDTDGLISLQDLLGPQDDADSSNSWLDGPIQIDEILVNLSDSMGLRQDQFSVEQIELEGFAVGEPMAFRFRGNVGDPALFDWLEIDALMVPQPAGQFRLTNMRMTGSLEDGHFDFELLGNLDILPGLPMTMALDAGLLRINEHEFEAQLNYIMRSRPFVDLELSSDFVDLHLVALPSLLQDQVGANGSSQIVSALQGLDFDLNVVVDQVSQAGLILRNMALQAQSRSRQIRVDLLEADLPGGYLSAIGNVDMASSGWPTELGLRVDADEFALLAGAIPWDWAPAGEGAISLLLKLESGQEGLTVDGEGEIEIWNGRWPLVAGMVPDEWIDSDIDQFQFLSSPIEISRQLISLPEFQMVSSSIVAQGQLDLGWPPGPLAGALDLTRGDEVVRAQVSGSLDVPRAVLTPLQVFNDP